MRISEIENDVKMVYNNWIFTYGNDRILGTFVVGRFNYGIAEKLEDLITVTIYLPSFEDLCCANPIKNTDSRHKLIDIRNIYMAEKNPSLNYLELLYSDYTIINEKYKKYYEDKLYNNRDEIGKCNKYNRSKGAIERIEKYFDDNRILDGLRLNLSLLNYLENKDINSCYHLDKESLNVISKIEKEFTYKKEVLEDLNKRLSLLKEEEKETNYNSCKILKEGIIGLIEMSLKPCASIDSFISILKPKELKAWEFLSSLNEKEINISVTRLEEDSKISRSIWTSLFRKMTTAEIAIIESHGVKGTKIILKE